MTAKKQKSHESSPARGQAATTIPLPLRPDQERVIAAYINLTEEPANVVHQRIAESLLPALDELLKPYHDLVEHYAVEHEKLKRSLRIGLPFAATESETDTALAYAGAVPS